MVQQNHPKSSIHEYCKLIDLWIQSQVDYHEIPALAIGIVSNQEVLFKKTWASDFFEQQQDVNEQSLFRIASHTKLFTATSVILLRDLNLLDLEDPVEKHIPEIKNIQNQNSVIPITIRHLLTHTAGLPRETGHPYWTDFDFPNGDRILNQLKSLECIYPTDDQWKYSNLGYSLLGEIISRVSGLSYESFVQENILKPLQLDHTAFEPQLDQPHIIHGFGRRIPKQGRQKFQNIASHALNPATGLFSDLNDMIKFTQWQLSLLKGTTTNVLSQKNFIEMTSPQWEQDGWKNAWGYGYAINPSPERTLIGHDGMYPGYSSLTRFSPNENIGITILSNAIDTNTYLYSNRLFEWIGLANSSPQSHQDQPNWNGIFGHYQSIWRDFLILKLGHQLKVLNPYCENPIADSFTLEEIKEGEFKIRENILAPHGEDASFTFDSKGIAQQVRFGDHIADRVDRYT